MTLQQKNQLVLNIINNRLILNLIKEYIKDKTIIDDFKQDLYLILIQSEKICPNNHQFNLRYTINIIKNQTTSTQTYHYKTYRNHGFYKYKDKTLEIIPLEWLNHDVEDIILNNDIREEQINKINNWLNNILLKIHNRNELNWKLKLEPFILYYFKGIKMNDILSILGITKDTFHYWKSTWDNYLIEELGMEYINLLKKFREYQMKKYYDSNNQRVYTNVFNV